MIINFTKFKLTGKFNNIILFYRMSEKAIKKMIKSFNFEKEAYFYKIRGNNMLKIENRINTGGLVQNLNWNIGLNESNTGPPSNDTISSPFSEYMDSNGIINQLEIVILLQLFCAHDFDIKRIRSHISDNVYPPIDGVENEKVIQWCEEKNYDGYYIANYWVKFILSNRDYFNVNAIFKDYM